MVVIASIIRKRKVHIHKVSVQINPRNTDVPSNVSAAQWHPFRFQTSEHSLHRAIVPAVSSATYAPAHLVTPQPLFVLPRTALAALVGVKCFSRKPYVYAG